MRSLEELDYYELLEVPRDARPEEIERGYALVREAYEDESVAAYSVFDGDEAVALRERIDHAYRVLSDPEARRAYDAAFDDAAAVDALGAAVAGDAEGVEDGFGAEEARELPIAEEPAGRPVEPRFEGFEEVDDGEDAIWDGARLRRARLLRGVELDALASVTKINPTYLRFLEEERFADLPAAVYVRGFVGAYARHLGLDANRVSRSYAARFEEHRQAKPRGRLHR